MAGDEPELSERQREILQAILEDYIATAEPVGSRTLTKRNPNIDLSPATVRNAMSDLEELGFLSAPHASAGRVPTALAFRIYVERLAQRGRISPKERELIQGIADTQDGRRDFSEILQDAGRVLSVVSKHAALVLLPGLDDVIFEHIQFVPVRDQTVLAVLVTKSGLIQQQVIDVQFRVDRDELNRLSNYLTSHLAGKTLGEVRAEIVRAMHDERNAADELMKTALMLGERALAQPRERGMVVEGERTFLDQPEFNDIAKLRTILRAFEEKTLLLRLLDAATTPNIRPIDARSAANSDTRVVLGIEGSVKELKDLALVTTTYASAEGHEGRLAVVGPTRMDYSRVIPLVELTAEALSQSFRSKNDRTPVAGAAEPLEATEEP
jgi:heat-inducible transcriptional repressor